MSTRFAVGHAGGPQSCSWKLWAQGNEAYLLQRGIASQHHKFSFHSSGNCRWARIQPGISGIHRAILEWERDAVPPASSGQGSLLLSVAFPTNHLSCPRITEQKQLRWIESAPAGRAVLIELFIIREDKAVVEQLLSTSGERQLLHHQILRNGLRFCATASQFDCGPVNMNMPDKLGAVFGEVSFPDQDNRGTGRPIRMILMPEKDLPPMVWELGGYEVAKISPKLAPNSAQFKSSATLPRTLKNGVFPRILLS